MARPTPAPWPGANPTAIATPPESEVIDVSSLAVTFKSRVAFAVLLLSIEAVMLRSIALKVPAAAPASEAAKPLPPPIPTAPEPAMAMASIEAPLVCGLADAVTLMSFAEVNVVVVTIA